MFYYVYLIFCDLAELLSSRNVFITFLEFSVKTIISSVNGDRFTSFFIPFLALLHSLKHLMRNEKRH